MAAPIKCDRVRIALLAAGFVGLVSCAFNMPVQSASSPNLKVTSTAFGDGKAIPKKYTGDDKDVSPALQWSAPPAGTKSIAISCEDPDAPVGIWWHWIIYNIPPDVKSLKEGIEKTETLANGASQGTNDFKKVGYNGPAPPPGAMHHYHFKVVALDTKLLLKPGCTKTEFAGALRGHVLGSGELTGTYSR